jgi:WD40 repeat protein
MESLLNLPDETFIEVSSYFIVQDFFNLENGITSRQLREKWLRRKDQILRITFKKEFLPERKLNKLFFLRLRSRSIVFGDENGNLEIQNEKTGLIEPKNTSFGFIKPDLSCQSFFELVDGRIIFASSDKTIKIWKYPHDEVFIFARPSAIVTLIRQLLDGRIITCCKDEQSCKI